MHNIEEVAALLHIHEKALAHGGALENIKNQAWTKLKQINDEYGAPSTAPPVPAEVPVEEAPVEEEESEK